MATVQDLFNQIDDLIEKQIDTLGKAAAAQYRKNREKILAAVRDLWDKASVPPRKSAQTGNIRYVDRSQAFKYGRFDKLTEEIQGVRRTGVAWDISALESAMIDVYNDSYNGAAWVYNQGYGLPITGGVRVRLAANAVYSDFYGDLFDKFLRKNWATFETDILQTARRGLNQGLSYGRIANQLQGLTESSYSKMLRIATTEAGRVQTVASIDSLDLLKETGAEFEKEWFKNANGPGVADREDHWSMNGRKADKDGIFTLPDGAAGLGPRLTGSARNDINCHCSFITIVEGQRPEEVRIRDGGIIPFDEFSRGKRVTKSQIKKPLN